MLLRVCCVMGMRTLHLFVYSKPTYSDPVSLEVGHCRPLFHDNKNGERRRDSAEKPLCGRFLDCVGFVWWWFHPITIAGTGPPRQWCNVYQVPVNAASF